MREKRLDNIYKKKKKDSENLFLKDKELNLLRFGKKELLIRKLIRD
jgi:hypothetical protein